MTLSKQQRYQRRHKKEGLCIACSEKATGTYCLYHKQKSIERSQRRRDKLKSKGLCTTCGKYKVTPEISTTRCRLCFYKYKNVKSS